MSKTIIKFLRYALAPRVLESFTYSMGRKGLDIFHKKRRSLIMILALWILSFLSLWGVYISYGARQAALSLKRLTEISSLHFIAEAGVRKAIFYLNKDDTPYVDSFNEEWANSESLFKQIKVGKGEFSLVYSYIDGKEEKLIFGIRDEASKLNLNKAKRQDIEELLKLVLEDSSKAQEISAAIVDFRDSDSSLSIPIGSGEDSYYTNLSEPYKCKDAPFEIMEELLLVKGIDEDIFDKIKNYVTIYGEGGVNINTASEQVLRSLGIGDSLVKKIISYRKGEDDIEGTRDDNIFSSPQIIVSSLSKKYSLDSSEVAQLSNLVSQDKLVTASAYFMINSQAQLPNSKSEYRIICVVDKTGKIIYWQES